MTAPPTDHARVLHLRSPTGEWEMVQRSPHPALRGVVDGSYQGWIDTASRPLCRREVAGCLVPMIFNFGAPFLVGGTHLREPLLCSSFAAGLWDGPALSQATGATIAIQLNLTPLGAYRVLGTAMNALANRIVPLADLLGPVCRSLIGQLAETTSWSARFDLLDSFLLQRLAAGRQPAAAITWAWEELVGTQGQRSIGELARVLGWSHRRLIEHWHDHFGLNPKTTARLVRFEALISSLPMVEHNGWAAVAADCGYADQSHLIRDCQALAGVTPSELLAGQLGDGGGLDAGVLLTAP